MQNETKIFPPKEVAMELKRVGFNELCVGIYLSHHDNDSTEPYMKGWLSNNNGLVSSLSCTAPTYDQVIGWFAEVHGIDFGMKVDLDFKEYCCNVWYKLENKSIDIPWYYNRQTVLLTAFREAIKLIDK